MKPTFHSGKTTVRTVAVAGALCGLLIVSATAQAQTARKWASERTLMVEAEVATAGVKDPRVLAAMKATPRHEFVPADVRAYAYYDMALPIGQGQTISPPFVVGSMTQQLAPEPTDRVLEIGTGSGYQAAILSPLVKEVYTIEIDPVLAERAQKTFQKLKYKNVELKQGDGYQGWAEHAPFDKIIVTCSPEKIPKPLVDQLREGGRLIIPLGQRFQQTLYVMAKEDGKLQVQSREPTFFVPMTGHADALRTASDEGPMTPLANGDFETMLEPGKPAGWYYLRQAAIIDDKSPATGEHYIRFRNLVPGRNAQALQAVGVDGSRASQLVVDLWVKARELSPATAEAPGARLVVSFFDSNRAPIGQQSAGPWSGTFDWQRRSARLRVPPEARTAIVGLGLLGTTGEMSCDQVAIRVAAERSAVTPAALQSR
jgi:protein-L-isoaspartate(D-aspartate) O-methyltransferase